MPDVSRPNAAWLAIAIASVTVATTVRWNTFAPWGTDSAAYVEEAHRWESEDLFAPSPLQLWWPNEASVAPFGFRPGVERGTDVGQYPLGFPLLMATAIRLAGPLFAYTVVPLAAGVLVWCAYILAASLAGPWAGLLTSFVLAASPILHVVAVQPMSDVPAAALWALSWVMSLRPGLGAAAASGAATGMAMMVRPNLAPLAVVVAMVVLLRERGPSLVDWRRLTTFAAFAGVGPLVVGWSHAALYGSVRDIGYLGQSTFYRLAHVSASATLYPRLLSAAHTPLIFGGFVAAALSWWRPVRDRLEPKARRMAWSAAGVIVMNYLLYLPYLPLPDPGVARFMLPAFVALVVLFAGLLVHLSRGAASSSRVLAALVIVVPVAIVTQRPVVFVRYAWQLHEDQAHLRLAGAYLEAALPRNAAILTSNQAGGLAHFTKRLIVRADGIDRTALDGVVAELRRRGYHPVFVLESAEASWFRAHFFSSRLRMLDWPARATFFASMTYWDPADAAAHASGVRWATDEVH